MERSAWIRLWGKEHLDALGCPSCASIVKLRMVMVGDVHTRLGYGAIWCESCLKGVKMSRVAACEGMRVITFDNNDEINAGFGSAAIEWQ